jgi:hypothetical protein
MRPRHGRGAEHEHADQPSLRGARAINARTAAATSAPGLGSLIPHLRRDWARLVPHLRRDWARSYHICAGAGLAPVQVWHGGWSQSRSRNGAGSGWRLG